MPWIRYWKIIDSIPLSISIACEINNTIYQVIEMNIDQLTEICWCASCRSASDIFLHEIGHGINSRATIPISLDSLADSTLSRGLPWMGSIETSILFLFASLSRCRSLPLVGPLPFLFNVEAIYIYKESRKGLHIF